MTFVLKEPRLAGKMGNLKEDIEKILARRRSEEDARVVQTSNEKLLQDSLKIEFDVEVDQLKAAAKITVLPLLEVVGKSIGKTPVLESYEPSRGPRSFFRCYGKIENDVTRKVEATDRNLSKKTFYDYPMVRARLTLVEPTSRAHWEADDDTPGIYLDVLCLRKQKKNYLGIVEECSGIEIVVTANPMENNRLEKYILAEFERLS